MAVLHNLDPFDALKIFYQGETDGFPEEDFAENLKTRGIILPPILHRFLREYGFMTVNRQSDAPRFIHPNIMTKRIFRYGEGKELPLLIIGRVEDFEITVIDEKNDDPAVLLMKNTPKQAQVLPSDDTLSELFKVMFVALMMKTNGAIVADEPELATRLLRENGFDLEAITNNPVLHREYSLCFSEDLRTFTAAEFKEGELEKFFFLRSERFLKGLKEIQETEQKAIT